MVGAGVFLIVADSPMANIIHLYLWTAIILNFGLKKSIFSLCYNQDLPWRGNGLSLPAWEGHFFFLIGV